MPPILVVRVILEDEKGKILFLKRKDTKHASGKWSLPGGKIGFGEKEEESCIREIKEETNLNIFNIKFLFKKDDKNYLILYFKADFSGDIKLNEESSEYAWMGLEEIDRMNIAFNQKEAIKEFRVGFLD